MKIFEFRERLSKLYFEPENFFLNPFPEDITPKTLLKPSPTVSGHLADSNDLQTRKSIHWLVRPFKSEFFFDKNLKIRQIGTKFSFSIGKAFTRFISAKIQLLSWYDSSLGKWLPSPEAKIISWKKILKKIPKKKNFWEEKTYFLPDREKSELEMNCIWQVWMTQKWWCHIRSNVPKLEFESNWFCLLWQIFILEGVKYITIAIESVK